MRRQVTSLILASLWIAGGLAGAQTGQPGKAESIASPATARATLKDAAGKSIGEASLRETPSGVLIAVDLSGAPAGVHAFHVHGTGKCEPPKFDSAGGHLGAAAKQHGFLNSAGPHAGDLPNVHVPADGRLSFEVLLPGATLSSGSGALLDADGAALVLHAAADDYRTNPAGAAGDRIACGVITR